MKNNKLLKLRLYFTLKAMKMYKRYKESNIRIGPFIYLLLSITFLELVSKEIMIGQLNINIINMLIFTLPIALLCTVLTKLFNKTVNKVILFILTFVLCIYYEIQFVFFILFSVSLTNIINALKKNSGYIYNEYKSFKTILIISVLF